MCWITKSSSSTKPYPFLRRQADQAVQDPAERDDRELPLRPRLRFATAFRLERVATRSAILRCPARNRHTEMELQPLKHWKWAVVVERLGRQAPP
jgi:hypothetical protein